MLSAAKILDDYIDAMKQGDKPQLGHARSSLGSFLGLVPALEIAEHFAALGTVTPNAAFRHQSRERFMQAVEHKHWESGISRQAKKRMLAQQRRPRTLAVRLGVASMAFVIVCAPVFAMAHESVPGNPLYPLKRALEQARIGLTLSNDGKAKQYIEMARERAHELDVVGVSSPYKDQLLSELAQDMTHACSTGNHIDEARAIIITLERAQPGLTQNLPATVPAGEKGLIDAIANSKTSPSDKPSDIKRETDKQTTVPSTTDNRSLVKPHAGESSLNKGDNQTNAQRPQHETTHETSKPEHPSTSDCPKQTEPVVKDKPVAVTPAQPTEPKPAPNERIDKPDNQTPATSPTPSQLSRGNPENVSIGNGSDNGNGNDNGNGHGAQEK